MLGCALAAAGGCARLVRSNSPVASPEGVRIELLRESCEDGRGGGSFIITHSTDVRLAVRNPTGRALRFAPRFVMLHASEEFRENADEVLRVAPDQPGPDQTLAPGESRTVNLQYLHYFRCSNLELTFAQALVVEESAATVELESLRFSP